MQGYFDLNSGVLMIEAIQFNCIKSKNKKGGEYYKIFNLDKIDVGGLKIDPISNKISGGLTHSVDMMFSSYNHSNIIFKRVAFNGNKRYRMSRNKASNVAVKRIDIATSKVSDINDYIIDEGNKESKDFNNSHKVAP